MLSKSTLYVANKLTKSSPSTSVLHVKLNSKQFPTFQANTLGWQLMQHNFLHLTLPCLLPVKYRISRESFYFQSLIFFQERLTNVPLLGLTHVLKILNFAFKLRRFRGKTFFRFSLSKNNTAGISVIAVRSWGGNVKLFSYHDIK